MSHHPGYTCRQFSLANAGTDRATDLANLLRRVADEIDVRRLAPTDILDLTIAREMTEEGPWWSATLYWSPEPAGEQPGRGAGWTRDGV